MRNQTSDPSNGLLHVVSHQLKCANSSHYLRIPPNEGGVKTLDPPGDSTLNALQKDHREKSFGAGQPTSTCSIFKTGLFLEYPKALENAVEVVSTSGSLVRFIQNEV